MLWTHFWISEPMKRQRPIVEPRIPVINLHKCLTRLHGNIWLYIVTMNFKSGQPTCTILDVLASTWDMILQGEDVTLASQLKFGLHECPDKRKRCHLIYYWCKVSPSLSARRQSIQKYHLCGSWNSPYWSLLLTVFGHRTRLITMIGADWYPSTVCAVSTISRSTNIV